MTIDEAIKHCEEVADYNEKLRKYLLGEHTEENTKAFIALWTCAEEHRQLAEWLKELKKYREILDNAENTIKDTYGSVIIEGWADVVDQMKEVYTLGSYFEMEMSDNDNRRGYKTSQRDCRT